MSTDGENLANSRAELTIQAASVETKTTDRDAQLKSADLLDVENFPTLAFVSTAVAAKGADCKLSLDVEANKQA